MIEPWMTSATLIATAMMIGLSAVTSSGQTEANATLEVDLAAEGKPISPVLYGVFFEDINYAADGGLYSELLLNRSFETYAFRGMNWPVEPKPLDWTPLSGWDKVERGLTAHLGVQIQHPLNDHNTNYLQLRVEGEGSGSAGVSNRGFDQREGHGLSVKAGASYDVSLFARKESENAGNLTARLETPDGTVLAEAKLGAAGSAWGRLAGTLKPNADTKNAIFVLTTDAPGTLALDVISLFPQKTFKDRPNGLRPDLAQAIADIHPKTLRFPGGCIVHGNGLANAYRWKDSVGPIETRKPNWNRWGYHQSYGLGYFEYLQFAEDIGAEPLPILPVGVSCGFEPPFQVAEGPELEAMIQDVLDLVEFCNGDTSTTWGKLRADMGHPEPFNLKYIGLGNEEHDTQPFRELFPKFVDALRAKHPEITIVGTSGLSEHVPLLKLMADNDVPIADEHYYLPPEWFIDHQHRFDTVSREGPKRYVGEYASMGNKLFNAVAEAVYLTGIENNPDAVVMTAYAPLLAHEHYTQWKQANLIHFNQDHVVLTPNYHVQRMFATNQGTQSVQHKLSVPDAFAKVGASVSLDEKTGSLILKLANPTESPLTLGVTLNGDASFSKGTIETLAGAKNAENTFAEPEAVSPKHGSVSIANKKLSLDLPAMSVSVVRLEK